MRFNYPKSIVKTAVIALAILLPIAGVARAQTVSLSLTAAEQTAVQPDGVSIPMWGWVCGNVTGGGSCTAANGAPQAGGTTWQPPLITVPTGSSLAITLTNQLKVHTSITIVGQLGGGQGTPTFQSSPNHISQPTTWPVAGDTTGPTFTPPTQQDRVQSFGAQVDPAATSSPALTWNNLRPGTYLIESGTHPSIQGPMGLYGVLVVTSAPSPSAVGVAYPNVSYDADTIALLSEIDPTQNRAVDAAVHNPTGFVETATRTLTMGDAVTAISIVSGGSGYTSAPAVTIAGGGGNSATADATVDLTPGSPTYGQVTSITVTNGGKAYTSAPNVTIGASPSGPSATASAQAGLSLAPSAACGGAPACYPPAVNFTPLYYLINGQSFDKTAPMKSVLPISPSLVSPNGVLLRLVNAGLHMHVPSVVGLDMALIAEDGNVLPGIPKVQNEVFLAAGKVYDVRLSPPTSGTPASYSKANYPLYDRQLSLSANNQTDGGMHAILQISGGVSLAPITQTATVNPDSYFINPNVTLTVSDAAKGVVANDLGVYGVQVLQGPTGGSLTLNPDGTFTYIPNSGTTTDSFTYEANGSASLTTTVTLAACTGTCHGGGPTAVNDSYTSAASNVLRINRPGVLGNDSDPSGFPLTAVLQSASCSVNLNQDGSFTASTTSPGTPCSFTYKAQNSQGTLSSAATASIVFPTGNGPTVTVRDATDPTIVLGDYKWVLEEDDTLHNPAGVTTPSSTGIPTLTTSFHTSHMTLIASGCTGSISCGDGQMVFDNNPQSATFGQHIAVTPDPVVTLSQIVLDPTKHYYLSVLPGDAADPAHTMGGSPIAPGQTAVTVLLEPSPLPPAQLSVFVFEDNNPTNGDIDTVEEQQGLGGFQVILNDVAGATGDPTGQMTYDMFNMPLTNALANAKDTATGHNMCPITKGPNDLMGMIITCPALEDDNRTPSPVAGQALIKNLFPNRFDVLVNPGAVREAAGENWIQTSTLEGTRANDAFAKAGEPAYFQEFGPPGFHAFVGFVNPDHIAAANKALKGNNTVAGKITMLHMSRPSNVTLYDSASHESLSQTTTYVGLNSAGGSGENIAFAACDEQGNYSLTGVPPGSYELVVWDQWLDQIIDYEAVTVPAGSSHATINVGDKPVFSWFTRVETSIFFDANKDGVRQSNEAGLSQLTMRTRYRDGAISNFIPTDTDGNSPFDELFPLFNWYVIESDTTRYKGTGVHVAVDGGGAVDQSGLYTGILSSTYPTGESSVKTDPGTTLSEGIQSFISQTIQMDWGKTPYVTGENGGLLGHVIYASTRPFDDPTLGFQNTWEPLVPRVQVNLFQESTGPDGTMTLVPIDSTTTSSWDDYVNGTHIDPTTHAAVPNMQCPGQLTSDPFYTYTLQGLPAGQKRCYDGFHNWNQAQPAPFDGQYQFPSPAYVAAHPLSQAQINAGQTLVSLPSGKYVVEVVVPPGYQIVKEEDKNILIGDTYIAPAVQQFAGLASIFILPDQAEIGAANNTNPNDPTSGLGRTSFANFGPGGVGINNTPCVGQMRVVPDYLSLFPAVQQVAPFAGAVRPLCDRREALLEDQTQAGADFLIFTPTPIASHFTGIILDDASAEFNTAAPDFGEKFGVPFVPVSFRDFNGVETFRTYSDQFGAFNGMVYSTWAVNPPNPTGYAPNMMITCMNDPGPIPDPAHPGQLITDPMYNPNYSNFCYTVSFMPGTTDYMDTPVLPLAAFASGYNYVDCAYPDTTPAILTVTGDAIGAGAGPWISATGSGHPLTITALGDQQVPNNAYTGPSGNPAGLSGMKTVTRHYGFGSSQTPGQVTLGSVPLTITGWSDTSITAWAPAGATTGQLVITAANGKKSIDAVTVTIETKKPTYVSAPPQNVVTGIGSGLPHPIQDAIDTAAAGDLIIIGPGTYPELVIMSKPVRLQGVGAAAVILNATKFPTQKVADWRTRINALFAYDSQGNPIPGKTPLVDPLPGQEITGGVVLLEPSVLSTEEGAGITVLAKNLGTSGNSRCTSTINGTVVYNFYCADGNLSRTGHVAKPRIDGISITGGDAGGAIYVNGWAHNLEISNNRIYGNAGTFSGGVRVGQPYLEGQTLPPNPSNQFGFNYDTNVNIHNNKITNNGTIESNIGENGGGGGVSICSGTDNYKLQGNFICGNYSQGDGGGVGHVGLSNNGNISNNTIIFNQSFFQGFNTSGGGVVIEGEPSSLGGLSLGSGNVTVDSNQILGNHAGGGHGGGIRLQSVNGADISRNVRKGLWKVNITNNMITNNVAGYSGGGISMLDVTNSSIVNNTIVSNDSTATVGALFTTSHSTSSYQPAGVSAELHSPALATASQQSYSNPTLTGNIIYGNRSFYFTSGTTDPVTGATPSSLVPALTSGAGYACPTGANYWDLGVVGQPQTNQTLFLTPASTKLTALTAANGYKATAQTTNNSAGDPLVTRQYCNGSRANPGIPDTTPTAPPQQFSMQVAAAEDEGGNFIDVHYGPLSLSDSSIATGGANYGAPLGDYHLQGTSTAINAEPCSVGNGLGNTHDFDGQTRPQPACGISANSSYDIGADEFVGATAAVANVTGGPLAFGNVVVGTTSGSQTLTLHNTGNAPLTGITLNFTGPYSQAGGTCQTTLNAASTCTITVVFKPTATGAAPGSLAISGSVGVTNSPVSLSGTGIAAVVSASLSPTSHNFGNATRGSLLGGLQVFTLSNTGNVTLTGITAPTLSGTNPGYWAVVGLGTTCGSIQTTLAPNAACVVTLQFRPPSAARGGTTGAKSATLNVTDLAGTQSSTLSGNVQ